MCEENSLVPTLRIVCKSTKRQGARLQNCCYKLYGGLERPSALPNFQVKHIKDIKKK